MKLCIVSIVPIPEDYLDTARNGIEHSCRRVLHPDVELVLRAPSSGPSLGPAGLEYHRNPYFEHLIGGGVIETIMDAADEGFDAFIVNCFDDPGVRQARSLIDVPIFGLAEPTFRWASMLGGRFGALVPDMPGQVAYVTSQIAQLGLSDRLIPNGVRAERKRFVDSFGEAIADPAPMIDRLRTQAGEMVDEGAEVIVIACGGLGQICGAGTFHTLDHRGAAIPVVNPLTTAVKMAEMAVAMRRGLGYDIPSQAHAGTRLASGDYTAFRTAFRN